MTDLYRELFERSADAILVIEGEMFVDCNDAAVKMLRCRNRAEVLSTHPSELSPETQPDGRSSFEKASEMIALAFARGSHRFEWNHVRADGEVFPVEVLLTAVGERLHVVWRELSEHKLLEAKLREAQKMEIVGRLAAGVAHDFNNLLVVVLGNADLLCTILEPGTNAASLAAEIRDAGERGRHLVKRLLALGRKHQYMPSLLELGSLVDDLAALVRRLLGPDIRLDIEHGEAVTITADRGLVEQAILNLATNSRDAMPGGGRVSIATGVCEPEQATAFGLPALGRFAFLRVHDTGEGMDCSTLARACEPFFTTKPTGTGTGTGLASVQSTVNQSNGFLRITSGVGCGTTVALFWPLEHIEPPPELPPEAEIPVDEPSSASLAGVRILLVEDEDPVAAFVERTLHDSGCVLTRATNGQHALALFDADPNFDLILSDVIMPVMGGPAFVAALRERNIDIPVLFMSGYTNDAIAAAGLATEVLLEKPFSPWELRRAVRAAVRRV